MSGKALNIPNELVIEMYTKMQRIRKFEETAGAFFPKGRYRDSCTCISARKR